MDRNGWSPSAEISGRLRAKYARLQKIDEAMKTLEAEAEEKAEQDKGSRKVAKGELKQAKPRDKAQRNFTDPDSRIMKVSSTKSFEQCYNAQAVVDDTFQVVVAAAVTQEASDVNQVKPMVGVIESNLGSVPFRLAMSMDAGYYSEANVAFLKEVKIDPFIATARDKHSAPRPLTVMGRPPKNLSERERMERKLRTKRVRSIRSEKALWSQSLAKSSTLAD